MYVKLTCKQPTFLYVKAHEEKPLEIHFVCLGTQEIDCVSRLAA
jgi:hypothetical protein